MIVFYVMLAAIVIARAVGFLGVAALDSWHGSVRAGLAVMFIFTGLAHFTKTRGDLIKMVPPRFPAPALLVTLTGIAEIAGAFGLLLPALYHLAGWLLALLLIAMFPANIYASRVGHTIDERPHTPMALRLPLQLLWIGLLIWSVSG